MNSTRREFLRRAGITGAGAVVVGAGRRPARADETLAPFLHGVASGDPLHDRVILWTRVTPPEGHDGTPIEVTWTVATDANLTDVVATGTVVAAQDRDWTVKVDPTGLRGFTHYFYGFTALDLHSLTGRTKTAPAPGQDVAHLRLGLVSCANYQEGWFNAYARLVEREDLDAVLLPGDYLYEYEDGGYGPGSAIGRGHQPPVEMVDLVTYRGRHAHYKLDPDLRALHQRQPFVVTWDDHESANNAWRDGAENHNDGEGDWGARKAACQRAYDEWMPIRSAGDPAVIHRHLPWGELVDVIVLDTRLEGRDKQVTFPGTDTEAIGGLIITPETSDPDRRMISESQMAWLHDRLSASTARWKLVTQQVIVSQWNVGALPRVPDGTPIPDGPLLIRDGGNALNADAWDGYQADRDRFLDHVIDNQIDDVVILTGDVHSSWAFDVTKDPANPLVYNPVDGSGSVAVEFVCPAVASKSLGDTFNELTNVPVAAEVFDAGMRANNPQMKYLNAVDQGYVILDITPERCQADWFFVTVAEPNDDQVEGESWFTETGDNRLQQATGPAASKEAAAPVPARPPSASPPGPPPPVLPVTGGGLAVGAAALIAAGVVRRRS